jgi:hypothetical protein
MNKLNVFDLLTASGPFIEYAEKLMHYGQLVGVWDISIIRHKKDGKSTKEEANWVFTWILDGCGIQDVLYTIEEKPHKYGTTLSCYDSIMDAWHITWMKPHSGVFVNLLGRVIANRIVQEGIGSDYLKRERWSFTELTPTSFLWLGETSSDHGATWFLEEERRAVRSKK